MLASVPLLPILVAAVVLAVRPRSRWVLGAVATSTAAATVVLAAPASAAGWQAELAWVGPIVLRAALTPFSAVMALLVPAVALPILLWAAGDEDRPGLPRLIGLLLFFVGAMELLVVAADIVTLLIGWELVGACSWALIGHRWRDLDNLRSASTAFLVTRFGDLGLFAAAGALFAGSGGFELARITDLGGWQLQLAAAGIVLSASAKSAQVPFSPWLFRAMAGPSSVSALLHAATMVAAGAYLLARLEPQLAAVGWFGPVVIAVGLATALAGGVVAILQSHAKRLLAASTSAHYGLMFVAVGAGFPAVALAHLVVHAFFKAPLFLAAGTAEHAAGTYRLHRMRLGRGMPAVAGLVAVCALALAGAPLLGGGWTKDAIAAAAGHAGPVLAVAVLLAGGLSACYATRFLLLAFGRRRRPSERVAAMSAGSPSVWALALLAAPTAALSVLWIPAVADAVARTLDGRLPKAHAWELALAVLLVVLGAYAGRVLVRRRPAPDRDPRLAPAADWLGLPTLMHAAATVPSLRLAEWLAWFDDRVVDAPSRAVGAVGRGASALVAGGDRKVVDRGVELVARLGEWLAGASARIGELVVDGIPEGAARWVGSGGLDARRLQTGLAHHSYALIVGGAVILLTVVWLGGS